VLVQNLVQSTLASLGSKRPPLIWVLVREVSYDRISGRAPRTGSVLFFGTVGSTVPMNSAREVMPFCSLATPRLIYGNTRTWLHCICKTEMATS
jgi:hypothetical protein